MARGRDRTLVWLVSALLASGTYAFAQVRGGLGGFGRGFGGVRMAPEEMPDRKFAICRIIVRQRPHLQGGGRRLAHGLPPRRPESDDQVL